MYWLTRPATMGDRHFAHRNPAAVALPMLLGAPF